MALSSWFGLLVIFRAISFFSGMAQLPGQPQAHGGQYFFNDHGSEIPTDHAGYERGLRAQNRISSGGPAIFDGVAVVAWRRKGRNELAPFSRVAVTPPVERATRRSSSPFAATGSLA